MQILKWSKLRKKNKNKILDKRYPVEKDKFLTYDQLQEKTLKEIYQMAKDLKIPDTAK